MHSLLHHGHSLLIKLLYVNITLTTNYAMNQSFYF